jgi:hypothetical protein
MKLCWLEKHATPRPVKRCTVGWIPVKRVQSLEAKYLGIYRIILEFVWLFWNLLDFLPTIQPTVCGGWNIVKKRDSKLPRGHWNEKWKPIIKKATHTRGYYRYDWWMDNQIDLIKFKRPQHSIKAVINVIPSLKLIGGFRRKYQTDAWNASCCRVSTGYNRWSLCISCDRLAFSPEATDNSGKLQI